MDVPTSPDPKPRMWSKAISFLRLYKKRTILIFFLAFGWILTAIINLFFEAVSRHSLPWTIVFYWIWFIAICAAILLPGPLPQPSEVSGNYLLKWLSSVRERFGSQATLCLTGFALLVLSFHQRLHLSSLVSKVMEEIGTAFIVAAAVSFVFDINHQDKLIGEPIRDMKTLIEKFGNEVQDMKTLIEKFGNEVQDLKKFVEELNNTLGYFDFRKSILGSFKESKTRIVSVTDHWPIDSEWWKQPHSFTECELYKALSEYKNGSAPDKVVFMGRMPRPQNATDEEPTKTMECLKPRDFQRFLGVAWRCVVLNELRTRYKSNTHVDEGTVATEFSVMQADIPISVTVVDERVFVTVSNGANFWSSRGSELRRQFHNGDEAEAKKIKKETADTLEQFLMQCCAHSHSGSEYVISLMYNAFLFTADLLDETPLSDDSITYCLVKLGLLEWANAASLPNAHLIQDGSANIDITSEDLRNAAVLILRQFFVCTRIISNPNLAGRPPMSSLRKKLQ